MKNPKLAGRYAEALFVFSLEHNQLEKVYQDIVLIQNTLKSVRELRVVIESPVIFPSKKTQIFAAILQKHLSDITFGFLNLLINKKREPTLAEICKEFVGFYNKYHNIKIAQIITAQPLTENLLDQIKNILEEQTQSTIIIDSVINPDIIGGLLVKIDNFQIDATISAQINQLKMQFSQNIYKAAF